VYDGRNKTFWFFGYELGAQRNLITSRINAPTAEERLGNFSDWPYPLFNPATPDAVKELSKANIAKRLGYLNDQLANKQYLMGDKFTVADAYAFTIVNWTNFVKIDLKAYPNVAAYMGRVGARPKVQETLKSEGLLK